MEKVSVIIVTYNASKTLCEAIDSVLEQTYSNVECLIVDGNSQDSTMEIVESYGDKIRWISEPDNGIYDAMNKGWKLASGEWILYLGADDLLLPSGIELLINKSMNLDVVYGDTIFVKGKNEKAVKSLPIRYVRQRMVASHQSLMMRKNIFAALHGFDLKYKIVADAELVLRAFLAGYKFGQVDGCISRFSDEGISSRTYINIFEGYKMRKEKHICGIWTLRFSLAILLIKKWVRLNLIRRCY